MKIELRMEKGITLKMHEPYKGASYVEPVEERTCTGCKQPLQVRCTKYEQDDRAAWGEAHCVCGEHVGQLVVVFETIFGIEEDARVLNGRCRVY